MAALDLAFSPAERLGVLVVPSNESFNGLAQLIFGFEAGSVERLALQQAEYDFYLIQPTGRSGREMKLDPPFELREPIAVSFVRRVVVET